LSKNEPTRGKREPKVRRGIKPDFANNDLLASASGASVITLKADVSLGKKIKKI
jgi:hypothetical protein